MIAEAKPKPVKRPVEIFTQAEVNALLKACSRRGHSGVRNRASLAVLYRSGIRISELLSLYPRDLDEDGGYLNVRLGKGSKQRFASMDPHGWAELNVWLERRRHQLGIGANSPVICTLKGRPLDSSYFRQFMPRLAEKAGITKRCHAHALRHTMASELRREGVDIAIISRQLGHSSIAVTANYVQHLCPEEVAEKIRGRVWQQ